MELVKNVFFNTDKLVENAKVKISYVGKLFQENSSEVYLHYGFGSNWDNVNEIKMEKTELGFQAEIELLSSDTLNFCFRNSNNEWFPHQSGRSRMSRHIPVPCWQSWHGLPAANPRGHRHKTQRTCRLPPCCAAFA